MSGFFNKYPYGNDEVINLDWILERVKYFESQLSSVEERARQAAKDYVDERMEEELRLLKAELTAFKLEVNQNLASQNDSISKFKAEVNNRLDAIIEDLDNYKTDISNLVDVLTARVNSLYVYVDNENLKLENRLHQYIASQLLDVKVVDFFTGETVTLQEMFDKLAGFHAQNSLTWEEIGEDYPTLTWQEVVNYCSTNSITYSNMVLNSRTILDSI